jgi:hypothetical protein
VCRFRRDPEPEAGGSDAALTASPDGFAARRTYGCLSVRCTYPQSFGCASLNQPERSQNFVAKFVANCPDMGVGQAIPAQLSTACAAETTCIRLTFNPKVVGSNPTGGITK